jgi:hypothetical protein
MDEKKAVDFADGFGKAEQPGQPDEKLDGMQLQFRQRQAGSGLRNKGLLRKVFVGIIGMIQFVQDIHGKMNCMENTTSWKANPETSLAIGRLIPLFIMPLSEQAAAHGRLRSSQDHFNTVSAFAPWRSQNSRSLFSAGEAYRRFIRPGHPPC